MSNAISSRASVSSKPRAATVVAIKRTSTLLPVALKAGKTASVPFAVADISALAKSLRASFDGVDKTPGQVQVLNWLAKAAGFQNYQSLLARSASSQIAVSAPNPTGAPVDAHGSRIAKSKALVNEPDIALSAHAAKALTQFDSDGKLIRWPNKFAVQRIAMWGLWIRFDAKRRYSEKEVNSVFNAWHSFGDHATLRRELINMDLLARKPDCSLYWKRPQVPDEETRAFLRGLRGSSTTSPP